MFKTIITAAIIATSATSASAWYLKSGNDPFDGDYQIAIELTEAGSTYDHSIEYVGIQKDGDGVSVFLSSNSYMTDRGKIKVQYRCDSGPVVTEYWHATAEGTYAYLPRGYKDFKACLKTANTIALRVFDYRGVAADSTLKVKGRNHAKAVALLD